jgi:hypothetical protein
MATSETKERADPQEFRARMLLQAEIVNPVI